MFTKRVFIPIFMFVVLFAASNVSYSQNKNTPEVDPTVQQSTGTVIQIDGLYDKNGFDKEGYDMYGYDVNGFDRKGYDRDGYDKSGYDPRGNYRENNSGIKKNEEKPPADGKNDDWYKKRDNSEQSKTKNTDADSDTNNGR